MMNNSYGRHGMFSRYDGWRNQDDEEDFSNKDIIEHLKTMVERLDTLERRSAKMKKWRRKSNLFSERKSKREYVTLNKLNFDSKGNNDEKVDCDPFKEEMEVEEPEEELLDERSQEEETRDPEASPTRSLSAFDRIGQKLMISDILLLLFAIVRLEFRVCTEFCYLSMYFYLVSGRLTLFLGNFELIWGQNCEE